MNAHRGLVFGLGLLLAAMPLHARELHWSSVDVVARLQSDGALRVTETQAMVFTGDWNGGERVFDLRLGQDIQLLGISRIDPATGAVVEMEEGDLDEVNEYDWVDSTTLRWRSRLPSDPPFEQEEIVYRLELLYTGILEHQGEDRWLLDHEFLFAERDGVIEHASVTLELGEGWELAQTAPPEVEATALQPGQSLVVRRELRWTGAEEPPLAAVDRTPLWLALVLFVLVVLAAAERLLAWIRRDRKLGRFAPLPGPVDREWLEERLLSMPPEVVGAAWDRTVGSAEVAATLARLVQEGKVSSRVERKGWWIFQRKVLYLRREVPLEELREDVRPLIESIFPVGEETSTEILRKHYSGKTFSPAKRIRDALEKRVKAIRGFSEGEASPKPAWLPSFLCITAGLLLVAVGTILAKGGAREAVIVCAVVTLPGSILGWISAVAGQKKASLPLGAVIGVGIAILLHLVPLTALLLLPGVPLVARLGLTLFVIGCQRPFFNLMMTRESKTSLARRRELAAARKYFVEQLGRAQPALEDAWFPWLVAFGLAPQLQRWAKAFGFSGIATGAHSASISGISTGGGSSGGGSSGGWTGGGGAFGGAGASAAFAGAVSAFSAGVGTSSSGGGGGGGSSGGGGGGGW